MKVSFFGKAALISLLVLSFGELIAQEAYVSITAGYGGGQNTYMQQVYTSTDVDTLANVNQNKVRIGTGGNIGAAIGFKFNEHLSMDFGLSAFISGKSFVQ